MNTVTAINSNNNNNKRYCLIIPLPNPFALSFCKLYKSANYSPNYTKLKYRPWSFRELSRF